jgi:hypothetical protein
MPRFTYIGFESTSSIGDKLVVSRQLDVINAASHVLLQVHARHVGTRHVHGVRKNVFLSK